MTIYIPKTECKHRGLYRILARNLRIGVYDSSLGEFYGIREKFGTRFVFGEYHWDNGTPYGTVKPVELIPEELPADIQASERLPGLICSGKYPVKGCLKPVKGDHDGQYYYEHLDDVPCEAGALVRSGYQHNDPLFKWLEEMESKYPFDLQWDRSE